MKNTLKKLASLILMLCMTCSLLCAGVEAAEIGNSSPAAAFSKKVNKDFRYVVQTTEGDKISDYTIYYKNGFSLTVTGKGIFPFEKAEGYDDVYAIYPANGTELTFTIAYPEGVDTKASINVGDGEVLKFDRDHLSASHTVKWEPDYDFQTVNIMLDDGTGIVVEKVDITDVTLKCSQNKIPEFTAKVDPDAGYEIDYEVWVDETDDCSSIFSTFEPDSGMLAAHTYSYNVLVHPKEGYRFEENTQFYINGKQQKNTAVDFNFAIVNQASFIYFNTIHVSNKTLKKSSAAQSFSLNAKAKGGAELSYKSNNENVVVDANGKVTVKKNWTGKAKITVTAAKTSRYEKTKKTVTITVKDKKTQPMKLKTSSFTVKKSSVDKAKQTVKISVSSAKGKVTYSESSQYLTVSSKGVVTLKKGTPKGTYKVTVKAAGNEDYKSGTKTVKITVK